MNEIYDIAIVGAGPVGLSTALACAHYGLNVALIDKAPPDEAAASDSADTKIDTQIDVRASAIAAGSWAFFKNLGLADALSPHATPLRNMRVFEGHVGGYISPLSLHFETGPDAKSHAFAPVPDSMGMVIENTHISDILKTAVVSSSRIESFAPRTVESFDVQPSHIQLSFETGPSVSARLLVAADGRHSLCRQQAGISVSTTDYRQKALVTTISHSLPHDDTAFQAFYSGGPFAVLPLTQMRSQIVWSDKARAIDAALALPEAACLAEISRRVGPMLGEIAFAGPRLAYPLKLQLADSYTAPRLALVGDAAHTIHPLAGQGLNLGLRDAAALADICHRARSVGEDIGTNLDTYARWRHTDTQSLAQATDLLNRLFSNRLTPLTHLRRIGLGLVNSAPLVKSAVMRDAAGLAGDIPELMQ